MFASTNQSDHSGDRINRNEWIPSPRRVVTRLEMIGAPASRFARALQSGLQRRRRRRGSSLDPHIVGGEKIYAGVHIVGKLDDKIITTSHMFTSD